MFKLFRKELKPKVYAMLFKTKDDNNRVLISHGYTMEEAWKNIDDQEIEGKPRAWDEIDLEELANKYSEEKMSLEVLKK